MGDDDARKTHPRRQRWAVALTVVALGAVVLGGVAFGQRQTIRSLLTGSAAVGGTPRTSALTLPEGFTADVYADGLQAPRLLVAGPHNALYVAERGTGRVLAYTGVGGDGRATGQVVVADGMRDPTSVTFRGDDLYVGEASRVTRFTVGADLKGTGRTVIVPDLPTGGNHTTRTVLIGPDDRLYVSIGSTCNVCNEADARRATVQVYNLDGSGGRLYEQGLRNAVGLAVNPWNREVWATNNGRDLLGDDTPPETVYRLEDGADAGWPRCHAGTLVDPDFGKSGACDGVAAPLVAMQAHSAPLGLAFYKDGPFPAAYHGLFVAFHGSWNRSVPTGYKVVFVPLDAQGHVAGPVRDFATGWLASSSDAGGRPVGLTVGADGALYVSDDKAGKVYRITYRG